MSPEKRAASSPTNEEERKKRRSRKGMDKVYECEETECGKKFTRLEHLYRHQLNHRPKEIFHCTWEGCDKTFVREDLKLRHMDRHEKRASTSSSNGDGVVVKKRRESSLEPVTVTAATITTTTTTTTALSKSSNATAGKETEDKDKDGKPPTEDDPSDLISWLFSDAIMASTKDPILSPSFYNLESPMSLQSLLSPPSAHEEHTISDWKRQELLQCISIDHEEGTATAAFQRYIAKFWAYIHPQYPILHKPSFQADNCQTGLLWAILLLGSAIDKQHEFASQLAEPLRWYLFGSKDFHPPTKLWVIQALVMLELYEKTMAQRREHERAHIHHATTLQLLRRSSVLRGMESPREVDPWKRWIETEAAKRVALMAFVLDVFDATMFGHSMVMSVHEIRLSLPCSESIWAEFPDERGIPRIQSSPFLVALKKLLNKQHVETGPFGRRVLLGGLICISQQMQQRDLQVSTLGWGQLKDTWKEILGPAFNYWKYDYDNSLKDDVPMGAEASNYSYVMELQGCTSSFYHLAHMSMTITFLDIQVYAGGPSILNQPVRQVDHENSVRKVNEWANSHYGKKAYWHAVQFLKEMYLAEAQNNSSLYVAKCNCPDPRSRAGSTDHECKPFSDMIQVHYDATNDPVGKRPNAVYLCALVVWAQGYCAAGPESVILAETVSAIERELRAVSNNQTNGTKLVLEPDEALTTIENETNHIQSAEDGYNFLYRLSQLTPHQLSETRDRNNTVGLLRLVVESLKFHHTELVQEGRRLLIHCIDRSLGRNKIRCEFMFGDTTRG